MQDKKIPFSGPHASYITSVSILKLQLMISTQFTDQECLDWEKSLRIDLTETNFKILNDELLEGNILVQKPSLDKYIYKNPC